jgi:hypothetical protein
MLLQRPHIRFDKLIVWTECICVAGVFVAYMYFVTVSVAEAVVRSDLALEIRKAEARVSELESAYFAHLDTLTPSMLEGHNLVAVSPTAYVSVDANSGRLTRRD